MNYNLRIEVERVNGKFVAQVEVSGCGKCSRSRTVYSEFDEMMEGVADTYAQGIKAISAYNAPPPVEENAPEKVAATEDEPAPDTAAKTAKATNPKSHAPAEKPEKRRFAAT